MDDKILKLISNYQTPTSVIERLKGIQTVILTGITGAGKDTIIRSMLGDAQFAKVITSTTRAPRRNNGIMEEDGIDYYFLSQEQALKKISDGQYIEVNNVHGLIYGSLIEEYERIDGINRIALTTVDYQGADNFLGFGMDKLTVVFIVPPDFDTWLERITGRHGGSLENKQAEIINRLRSADREISHALQDSRFVPIMNVDIKTSAANIIDIVTINRALSEQEVANNHAVLRTLHQDIRNYLELAQNKS
jgi:guanylate kinase